MYTALSNQIRDCREGVLANPFQGKDKKVVFVCSMGILRSATAARLYSPIYNTRSAGTWHDALIHLSDSLMLWADEIVFVNKHNYEQVKGDLSVEDPEFWAKIEPKIKVLDIPDDFEHMHPELIRAFHKQYEPVPQGYGFLKGLDEFVNS